MESLLLMSGCKKLGSYQQNPICYRFVEDLNSIKYFEAETLHLQLQGAMGQIFINSILYAVFVAFLPFLSILFILNHHY